MAAAIALCFTRAGSHTKASNVSTIPPSFLSPTFALSPSPTSLALPSTGVGDVDAHSRAAAVGPSVRSSQAVQDGRRVEAAVVTELARDRLQSLRERAEEELVAAGDGDGVLAEVAGGLKKRGEEGKK